MFFCFIRDYSIYIHQATSLEKEVQICSAAEHAKKKKSFVFILAIEKVIGRWFQKWENQLIFQIRLEIGKGSENPMTHDLWGTADRYDKYDSVPLLEEWSVSHVHQDIFLG